jgi:hypothetical protein
MFSIISSRRKSGLSEGNGAIPVDLAPQALLPDGLGNKVHWTLQNRFEPAGECVNVIAVHTSSLRQ